MRPTPNEALTGLLGGPDPLAIDALSVDLLTKRVQARLFSSAGQPVSVGRYEIGARVGGGGGGVVYRAYDPELRREVALKILHATDHLDRRRVEAEALARLNHPHVIAVYDVFEHDGRLVVVMPFIDGASLDRWHAASEPGWRAIVDAFVAAGQGLAAAHRAGLVHRDVKPSNILMGADGEVLVVDFGIAASERPTTLESSAGTPDYMPPEQWDGVIDRRSDQFAFFASLRELLGDRPRVPSAVRRAIARGTQPKPDDRFDDMEAALHALQPKARPHWLAPAIAVGAVATASAAWASDESPCIDGATAIGTRYAWDAWLTDADTTLIPTTRAALDRYAQRWQTQYAAACAAESDVERDRQQRCLAAYRAEYEQVETMLRGPAAAGRNGILPILALPSPSDCGDPARRGLIAWQPHDDADQVLAAAIRDLILTARAENHGGDYATGAALAAQAMHRADEAGLEPLVILAAESLGIARAGAGKLAEAKVVLEEMYWRASKGGYDAEAAHAAMTLTFAVGYALADATEGRQWARHAEAALDRLGGSEHSRAQLRSHRGSVEIVAGEMERGLALHREALAMREASPDTRPDKLADSLNNVGNALLRLNRFAESIPLHERALEIRREHLGPWHPLVAISLNNLGAALLGDKQLERARAVLRQALRHGERSLGPSHPNLALALQNLAMLPPAPDADPGVNLGFAQRALAITEQHGRDNLPTLARSYAAVGDASLAAGRVAESRAAYAQALELLRGLDGDGRRLLPGTLRSAAEAAEQDGDHAAASRLRAEVEGAE